jgi:hypothetical protein
MKFKLLLCGAALLAAGCDLPQNPYGASAEYSYNYDMVPQPVPGISPAEMDKIEQAPVFENTDASYRAFRAAHNERP